MDENKKKQAIQGAIRANTLDIFRAANRKEIANYLIEAIDSETYKEKEILCERIGFIFLFATLEYANKLVENAGAAKKNECSSLLAAAIKHAKLED